MPKIPEKLNDFRMFVNDSPDLKAHADVTLPALNFMTETVSGAGVQGEYESPNYTHLQSTKVTVNWRLFCDEIIEFLKPEVIKIDLRAANQVLDSVTGKHEFTVTRAVIKGIPLNNEPGTLAKGAQYDGSTEVEVIYMKLEYEGRIIVEFDKINYIYKVAGVDYSEPLRNALGI